MVRNQVLDFEFFFRLHFLTAKFLSAGAFCVCARMVYTDFLEEAQVLCRIGCRVNWR